MPGAFRADGRRIDDDHARHWEFIHVVEFVRRESQVDTGGVVD